MTLIKIAFFAENGRLFQLPRLVNFQNFPNLPIIADKKMRKLTGQMAFFLEIQMETLGSFFLFNLHDDIKHRKKSIVILLNNDFE